MILTDGPAFNPRPSVDWAAIRAAEDAQRQKRATRRAHKKPKCLECGGTRFYTQRGSARYGCEKSATCQACHAYRPVFDKDRQEWVAPAPKRAEPAGVTTPAFAAFLAALAVPQAGVIRYLWRDLSRAVGDPPMVELVGANILLSWSKVGTYAEVEIHADGWTRWFCTLDRAAHRGAGAGDAESFTRPSPRLLAFLAEHWPPTPRENP